jgi:hypothetical protein
VGVGPGDDDIAVGGLGGRREAHRAQPVEQRRRVGLGRQHGRREAAQAQARGPFVGQDLAEHRVVVAAHVRRGRADPQMAVPAGHVVDQVGEGLRDRRTGVRGEEVVQVGGGTARVQRAAHRARREAVDRRPALRLHVREHVQHVRQRPFQRAGGHRRQVRLEQDVVQRLGQQRREEPGGGGTRHGLFGGGGGSGRRW